MGMWIVAAMGAFGFYWISRLQNRQPASLLLVLRVDVLSAHAKTRTILLDMVVSSLIGAAIATLITQPITPHQAVGAGLAWTGLASTYTKEAREYE